MGKPSPFSNTWPFRVWWVPGVVLYFNCEKNERFRKRSITFYKSHAIKQVFVATVLIGSIQCLSVNKHSLCKTVRVFDGQFLFWEINSVFGCFQKIVQKSDVFFFVMFIIFCCQTVKLGPSSAELITCRRHNLANGMVFFHFSLWISLIGFWQIEEELLISFLESCSNENFSVVVQWWLTEPIAAWWSMEEPLRNDLCFSCNLFQLVIGTPNGCSFWSPVRTAFLSDSSLKTLANTLCW